jgi:hypothetical protein
LPQRINWTEKRSAGHHDLGIYDHETGRVECAPNPYSANVFARVTAVNIGLIARREGFETPTT